MDLNLYCQRVNGAIEVLATYENKEDFLKYLKEAVDRNAKFGSFEDADRVVILFAEGAWVGKKQVKILKRALRHFDEVYLCNEIFDALEEIDESVKAVSLSNIVAPITDLSEYNI